MNGAFFTNLPSEMVIYILSRLPVRTIMSCKCVCKPWLYLIETREFAKAHLSNSVQGLATHVSGQQAELYRIFEFEDELDLEHHELHYNLVTNFSLPFYGWINSSANGLLFLCDIETDALHICNPITRDYIEFHCPPVFVYYDLKDVTYGFGVSKVTGQHKVVGIFLECVRDEETQELLSTHKSECHVYTVETGSWRRIAPGSPLVYDRLTTGAFLNGNLHWLVFDLDGHPLISCFDLERELFSTFASAPLPGNRGFNRGLFALGDCLCVCDNTSDDEIVIWLMKEYEVVDSWTKEFVISKILEFVLEPDVVRPIKVFKDGDILLALGQDFLFYYSKKDKTTRRIHDMFESGEGIGLVLHTPSLLSLKSFGRKDVSSF